MMRIAGGPRLETRDVCSDPRSSLARLKRQRYFTRGLRRVLRVCRVTMKFQLARPRRWPGIMDPSGAAKQALTACRAGGRRGLGRWHFHPGTVLLDVPWHLLLGTAQQYGLLCLLYCRSLHVLGS